MNIKYSPPPKNHEPDISNTGNLYISCSIRAVDCAGLLLVGGGFQQSHFHHCLGKNPKLTFSQTD